MSMPHPVLKIGTPVYKYEPGSWGLREGDPRVGSTGGWQNPSIRGSEG
jgi:hypothetical protein